MDNVKKFYDALATNEALKEEAAKLNEKHADSKLDEAALRAEIVTFASSEGYHFTLEELTAYVESIKKGVEPLSDDELFAVAGGIGDSYCWKTCFCIVGGGGTHESPKITCACVVGGSGKNCACRPSKKLLCVGSGQIVDASATVF